MPRILLVFVTLFTVSLTSSASSQAPPGEPSTGQALPAEQQIAAAVLAAPKEIMTTLPSGATRREDSSPSFARARERWSACPAIPRARSST